MNRFGKIPGARLNLIPYLLVLGVLISVLLFFQRTDNPGSDAAVREVLLFSVMGDVPRSDAEKEILRRQIDRHNAVGRARFVVHVGDIKSGQSPCTEAAYDSVARILKSLDVPLFIVPGDNEWNDCIAPGPEQA